MLGVEIALGHAVSECSTDGVVFELGNPTSAKAASDTKPSEKLPGSRQCPSWSEAFYRLRLRALVLLSTIGSWPSGHATPPWSKGAPTKSFRETLVIPAPRFQQIRALTRERAMLRFRSMKTLQKFSSIHAQVHNHFNQERHLVTRSVYKQKCSAALAEWGAFAA
jgi:hypothetical protein